MTQNKIKNNENKKTSNVINLNEMNIHAFLLKEFDQAWDHYRHVENQRSKIMNYFYTIIIGITVFTVNFINVDTTTFTSTIYLGFGTLLFLLFYYIFFSYSSVKKSSLVLRQYENVMDDIRKLCSTEEINLLNFNIRSKIEHSKFDYLFSFQKNSEAILFGSLVFIELLEILLIFKVWVIDLNVELYIILNIFYVVLCAIFLLIAIIYSHKHK